MTMSDGTTDPQLRSWVDSANDPTTDFPIQNLPFGVFARRGSGEAPRVGVAIGDQVIDLAACDAAGLFDAATSMIVARCAHGALNDLMRLGRDAATQAAIGVEPTDGSERSRSPSSRSALRRGSSFRCATASCRFPRTIGDYTDFYASVYHAQNVGSMFRPDNPLLPNYKWVPIGYHGRASSIVPSGTDVRRPWGQTRDGAEGAPTFAPSRRLDYELEVGVIHRRGQRTGHSDSDRRRRASRVRAVSRERLVGARHPGVGVSTARAVPREELRDDRLAVGRHARRARAVSRRRVRSAGGRPRAAAVSALRGERGSAAAFAISLEVLLSTAQMRASGIAPFRVSAGTFTDMYWTVAQLVTHHASNGCDLRPGDLLASGTVSGPTKESRGCLLERTWRGSEPLQLPTGETRAFLQDGDEVTLRGYCERPGYRRIGFGECTGRVASRARAMRRVMALRWRAVMSCIAAAMRSRVRVISMFRRRRSRRERRSPFHRPSRRRSSFRLPSRCRRCARESTRCSRRPTVSIARSAARWVDSSAISTCIDATVWI